MIRVVLALAIILLATSDVTAEERPPSPAVEKPSATAMGRDVYYKVGGTISGPRAPRLSADDYPQVLGESRVVVWVVAQQHLYWAAFVLGTLVLVGLLEVWSLFDRNHIRAGSFLELAQEFLNLVMLALALAAISGAVLLIVLIAFYPDLMAYLLSIFRPVFLVYGGLVLTFTVLAALYHFTWSSLRPGWRQWLHASLGVLLNVTGMTLAMLGNAWSSFMQSPAGVDEQGRYLGQAWNAIHTALWNPFNVHRLAGHIVCAGAVLAAYAASRALTTTEMNEKTHYDRMGAVALLFLLGALITMPFGGYRLMREIYAFQQQMGITLLGGLLAWQGIILVTVMAILFFSVNYYFWQRIDGALASAPYGGMSKWVFGVLTLCALVYITPHTMVMTPLELKNLGGQQHPVIGNYGGESAKSAAVNLMILVTAWSFLIWRFSHRGISPGDIPRHLQILTVVFLVGTTNILWLGVYGYYVPANVRVGLSVPMVATTFTVVVIAAFLDCRTRGKLVFSGLQWGRLSTRGYYALLLIAFTATWIMGLGGYQRSSVRLYWHVTDIMKDASPWAFTHTTGFATNIITLNALMFWVGIALISWLMAQNPCQSRTRQ
ncbi:MAG: cytochrome ubiquinol oxidase subunit I [Nitrospira sp.]|nr:cytochrome ubiquinol oxidase subunit I [Nitrospira sp.]